MRLLTGIVLVSGVCLIGCDESKDVYYATAADAVRDGAITRGWLPEALSTNATEIRESHDLDSNRGFADFRYTPALIPQLQQKCTSRPPSDGHHGYQSGNYSLSLDPTQRTGHLSH